MGNFFIFWYFPLDKSVQGEYNNCRIYPMGYIVCGKEVILWIRNVNAAGIRILPGARRCHGSSEIASTG